MPHKVYRRKKDSCSGKKIYVEDKSGYTVVKKKSSDPCVGNYYEEDCVDNSTSCNNDSTSCCCKSQSTECLCEGTNKVCESHTTSCCIVLSNNQHYDLTSYCDANDLKIIIDNEMGISSVKEILLPAPTLSNKGKTITILLSKSIHVNNGLKIGFRNNSAYYFVGTLLVAAIPANYYTSNTTTITTGSSTTKKSVHLVSSHQDYGGEFGTEIRFTYIGDINKVIVTGNVYNAHHNPNANKIFTTTGISYL